MPEQPALSIVLPVLNEAACLDRNLARLFDLPWVARHCEVIVSDGGSQDTSADIARAHGCRVVTGAAGRALQMNAAVAAASGARLLFLHADCRLPEGAEALLTTPAKWGFFRLRLSGSSPAFRVIESAINLRTRLSRVATGDQGLFFERGFFESLGGYAQIPLMEDIAICKLARRRTAPLIVGAPITTSSRRWRERGIVATVLLMWGLRFAYWLGVDPHRLHRIYYPQRG